MIFFFFLYDVIQIQTFTIRQTHTFSWCFWCFVIGMRKFFLKRKYAYLLIKSFENED